MEVNISKNLLRLSKDISCFFIDTRTTSKEFVYDSYRRYSETLKKTCGENFILSTCLRLESYHFDNKYDIKQENFYAVRGVLALRRLLSIIIGLQSEIIGECEILNQVHSAIDLSFKNGRLSKTIYSGLKELLIMGREIRNDLGITTEENYSTIGARLLNEYIKNTGKVSIMVIGGGYMAESFLTSVKDRIEKIIWVNRDIEKIKRKISIISFLPKEKVVFSNFSECNKFLLQADFIFSAVSNKPISFHNEDIRKDTFVIDVSYPPIFSCGNDRENIITIANTFFDKLVSRPIPKLSINLANNEIDRIIERL